MKSSFLLLAALVAAVPAQATVLFSEDFDSITTNATQITTTVGGLTVFGAVDAVVPVNPWGISVSSTVVDLDGSPGPGAVGKDGFNITAGNRYTLTFDLGGAQRGGAADGVFVALLAQPDWIGADAKGTGYFAFAQFLGEFGESFTALRDLQSTDPILRSTISFTSRTNSTFGFRIGTSSADNVGPLLDSVSFSVAPIPEPASWAMLIAGFGLVGTAMRRRRTAAAA
jgi:PEP-CTERM motif